MAKVNDFDSYQDVENVDLQATRVFFENFNSTKEININIGGGASSKSFSIAQLLAYKFLTEKSKKILVLRKTLPSMRTSVLWLFYRIFNAYGVKDRIKEDKTGMNFFYNDNVMHFQGLDDPEKTKCFHPDTDIFTPDGFKNIKEVKEGDLVASINPLTMEPAFVPIANYYVYDYRGDMYSPVSTGPRDTYAGFCVTPEHKMLVKTGRQKQWRFEEVKNLDSFYRFTIPQGAKWNIGERKEFFEIPKNDFSEDLGIGKKLYRTPDKFKKTKNGKKPTKFEMKNWLEFLGWYISEGCCADVTIKLSQTKEEGKNKLRKVLEDFPYHFREGKRGFELYGKDLCKYLKQFGKSHEKFIPREVLNLHPDLLKYLFDALIAGDGTDCGTGRYVYCSSSKQLAEDVYEMGVKLGYSPIIRSQGVSKNPNFKNARESWVVYLTPRKHVKIHNLKKEFYEGKTYCIETKPYHTVLTRYNGRIMWSGQSSDWNYMWFEEATEIKKDEFNTVRLYLRAASLDKKPNQIFMSFNPIDEFHWIKEYLIDNPEMDTNVNVVHSTYKDNPFIDERTKERYEELIKQDVNFYRIYALGEWGKLENLIYKNWDTVPMIPRDFKGGTVVYGLDFGWNDPTVITRSVVKEREAYHEEILYKPNMTNFDLITFMKRQIPKSEWSKPMYADSQMPDKIREIRLEGFNIKPAQKNVIDGIDFVKRMNNHILESSSNIVKEFRAYSWCSDKRGNVIDVPVDFLNHSADSLRYAMYSHFRGDGIYRIRWA
jgi:phage terminase large subunit